MKTIISNRIKLASEHGFTLIVTLGVLLVSGLLMTAAFVGAEGDIHLTQSDAAAKRAYYAAQAGVEDYEYHLTQDGNYLNYCTAPSPANSALNQYYKEGTKTPLKASELKTAEVPGPEGKSTGEKYAIQLLPAESDTAETSPKCNTSNVVESMIEQKLGGAAGTFRLESTGFAEGKERTLVATFKNLNFVSYVWYTVYETGDSSLYGKGGPECDHYYGERPACTSFDNYFISGETVNGPMHTEDHVGICGNPEFGRNENDRIEFGNGKNKEEKLGYSSESCGGTAEPKFKGKLIPPNETRSIQPPPGDEELEHIVETTPTNYKFEGKTEVALNGETMTITEHVGSHPTALEEAEEEKKKEVVKANVAFPPNGVIYVAGGCGTLYSPFGPKPGYTEDTECGNVYVHGEYKKSLTIAAQNDVIINGNITTPLSGEKPSTNAMLGLIANNFVRVYHPVTGKREQKFRKCGTAENEEANDLKGPEIYAAILALKHSFIVDNFDCGSPFSKPLKVYGAIAGEFTNGMTGVFSGKTVLSGYGYNLNYDNRLEVAEPPHFLNPIQAAWYVQRETLAPTP
jgi:Tfp pilus assembly protein PilX